MTDLPKWPQMLVLGESIDPLRAEEIIRRTDSFFIYGYGGNNRAYDKWLKELLGMPDQDYKQMRSWREKWDCISTAYVTNQWISSAFIYGPHGWCHPDGQIAYIDNVGKWPSIEDIKTDWESIAKAFPYLKLDATLWSGEHEEADAEPVVGLMVRNGGVELVEPTDPRLYVEFGATVHTAIAKAEKTCPRGHDAALEQISNMMVFPVNATDQLGFVPMSREQGVSLEIVKRWQSKARELGLIH